MNNNNNNISVLSYNQGSIKIKASLPYLNLKKMMTDPVNLTYKLNQFLTFKEWCQLILSIAVGEQNINILHKLCLFTRHAKFGNIGILNYSMNDTIIAKLSTTRKLNELIRTFSE